MENRRQRAGLIVTVLLVMVTTVFIVNKEAGTNANLGKSGDSPLIDIPQSTLAGIRTPTSMRRLPSVVDVVEIEEKDTFKSRFSREEREASWAHESEEKIKIMLGGIAPFRNHVAGIECKSSVCKVDVDHSDELSLEEFFKQIVVAPRWSGVTSFSRGQNLPSGRLVSVLYFAKA